MLNPFADDLRKAKSLHGICTEGSRADSYWLEGISNWGLIVTERVMMPPAAPMAVEEKPAIDKPAAPRMDYAELRPRHSLPPGVGGVMFVLTVLFGLLMAWSLSNIWIRWNNPNGYYQHGPLIFPISVVTAFLIIRKHGLTLSSTRTSRFWGLAMVLGALMIHLVCMFARVTFVSGFMIIPLYAGSMLYLGGWPMLRTLWFPVVFLSFMIPLPDITIYNINFHLKLFAADTSTALVNLAGIPVFGKGSEIFLTGDKRLMVDDMCGGLRSLISLMAFATLFSYACRVRGYKRWALFFSAVPIAVAANIVRITVLIVVANFYGTKLTSPGGWVHDSMGLVVFVVAFCLMFAEEEILDLLPGAKKGKSLLRSGTPATATPSGESA